MSPIEMPTFEKQSKSGYACTVINLMPIEIIEHKPHLLPSTYKIPAATKAGPGILHVEESVHYIPDHFDDKRSFKQVTTPMEMARSVVDDWKTSHIALGEGAEPGLIWVEGRLTAKEVVEKYSKLINKALEMQTQWYRNLIAMADADWAKNHNALAVSELQKMAAKELNVERDWLLNQAVVEQMNCPFCKTKIDPTSVKCMNCKEVVNQEEYNKMTKGAK